MGKKKTTKAMGKEENLPTLKTVDIKAIQQQMQEQMKKPAEKKVEKDNDPVFSKNESHVNKFKGIFDNDAKEEGERSLLVKIREEEREEKVISCQKSRHWKMQRKKDWKGSEKTRNGSSICCKKKWRDRKKTRFIRKKLKNP